MVDLASPKPKRLPNWLRRTVPEPVTTGTHRAIEKYGLNTVCESAMCPNRSECYSRSTATFMILGNTCTRSCQFCNIEAGQGEPLVLDEPQNVAKAAKELGLKYVVVTSVARDDLKDEGANHFAETVRAIRKELPNSQIEVLTPDFHAREELIKIVVDSGPEVFNHNVETVERLQVPVRVQGRYDRSLKVLELAKKTNQEMLTKSGLMLGLGETKDEIIQAAKDLRSVGCDILTLGQYLPPSKEHYPLTEFVKPEMFTELEQLLKPLGFQNVFSGPYVRSSYHAGEVFLNSNSK